MAKKCPIKDPIEWSDDMDRQLLTGYRNGVEIPTLASSVGVSRSTLYRRLKELREPAREPKKKSAGYYVPILISDQCHPLARTIFEFAKVERMTLQYLSDKSGVTRETIGNWARGSEPSLINLQAVASVVGLELRLGHKSKVSYHFDHS